MRERQRGAESGTQAFVLCAERCYTPQARDPGRSNYGEQRGTNPLGAQVIDLCSALRRASVS